MGEADSSASAFRAADEALSAGDYETALRIALPWADTGHSWAEACVGSLYQCGLGARKDVGIAIRYLQAAADKGHAGAWNSLAVIFEGGYDDTAPDSSKAAECYRRAAELGYLLGQRFDLPE